jgi:adenylate kinase family enzyme
MDLQRVNVVGVSGSGKSTFSRRLATLLGAPYIDMDALHWAPNWTEVPHEMFSERVRAAVSGERWVLDGNYDRTRAIKWSRSTSLNCLDYALSLALRRVITRSLVRLVTRAELWHGNRESLRMMFSRKSIVVWTLTTHAEKRKRYAQMMGDPAWAHICFIRLRTPAEAERFLNSLHA